MMLLSGSLAPDQILTTAPLLIRLRDQTQASQGENACGFTLTELALSITLKEHDHD